MTEEQAWRALVEFAKNMERVTVYRSEGLWYVEWFSLKGGYNWHSDESLITIVETITK